jgi:hypothetical protein
MSIQFITDSSGKNTGVYIPIEQWKRLKSKFRELEDEEIDIPEWHKVELDKRLESYSNNPDDVIDTETALDELAK